MSSDKQMQAAIEEFWRQRKSEAMRKLWEQLTPAKKQEAAKILQGFLLNQSGVDPDLLQKKLAELAQEK